MLTEFSEKDDAYHRSVEVICLFVVISDEFNYIYLLCLFIGVVQPTCNSCIYSTS